MSEKDWEIISAAFQKAVSLAGASRKAMLAGFTELHPELAEQLKELLAADSEDDERLASPIASAAESLSDQAIDPWEGEAIGAWTIQRRIADGGMGSVFLAERSDGEFQHQVAIKLMSSKVLGADAVQRFRVERQILANLVHPNIAPLVDGGTTDNGVPYLVMPYIDSVPIDQYCNDNKLTINDRLELVIRVGEAVEFAHRNLVVHRDLKPSNIVVDKNGEPQLLDFGIAKLLEGSTLDGNAALTREGERALTPECASPEQVRGEPVSVATDVYALGVLLFRLLTGQSPYSETSGSSYELANAILSEEPRRPSTVVTSPKTTVDSSSAINVGVDINAAPQVLRRKLLGDLDNIVLKSLQKEPERRYQSVRAQIQDLRHYLDKRPIAARPDSLGYRLRKFVARNVGSVVAASVVSIAAVTMVAYYTARLAEERDIAQQESAAAEQVTEFLVDIFSATEAHEKDAETVTVREVLDRGADQVDESLGDNPLVHARVLRHIASTYASIARYDDAEAKLLQALDILKRETGESAETAQAYYRVGNINLSHRRWDVSHENYEQALRIHRQQDEPNAKQIGQVLRLMVYTASRLGNMDAAEGYLNEMLPIIAAEYGPDDPSYANGLYSKASFLRDIGSNEQAAELAYQALGIITARFGEDAQEGLNYRHLVGLIEWDRENYEAALKQYEKAIELRTELLGPDHPSLFNFTYSLGSTFNKLGRFEESVATFERLLGLQRVALGADNSGVAFTLAAYGMVLLELDRVDDAEAAFREAVENYEAEYGPDHVELDVSIIGLGHVARRRGEFDAARSHYHRAVALREATRGPDNLMTARALASLGELELEAGNLAVARLLFKRALAIFENPEHRSSQGLNSAEEFLAEIEARQNDAVEYR